MFLFLTLLFSILEIIYIRFKRVRKVISQKCESQKVHSYMSALYPGSGVINEERKYIEGKIKLFLLILIVGCFFAFISDIKEKDNSVFIDENEIERNSYGEGARKLPIYIKSDELENTRLEIKISDRAYSYEETETLAGKMMTELDREMLGSNVSLNYVDSDLNFNSRIEEYPFKIVWKSEKPLVLGNDGKINRKKLKELIKESDEEALIVNVKAIISYEDYSSETTFPIRLVMPDEDTSQKFVESVKEAIYEEDINTRQNESIVLPDSIDGKRIEYYSKRELTPFIILSLSLLCGISIYYFKDQDLEKKVQMRKNELKEDYPRIINQYALYYLAGMHPKSIWKEICRDYRNNVSKGLNRRCAYEIMLRTEMKMADGMGEAEAYRDFAKECGLRNYKCFVNLIDQTLIKGKEKIAEELKKEAENAQNEKLSLAKIKGEEAGTKLLLPMFLMLMVVIVIVVIPAFTNFKM